MSITDMRVVYVICCIVFRWPVLEQHTLLHPLTRAMPNSLKMVLHALLFCKLANNACVHV